jgi:hypothetical protein
MEAQARPPTGCKSLQFAATGCKKLQVFHTKVAKETKRKIEV